MANFKRFKLRYVFSILLLFIAETSAANSIKTNKTQVKERKELHAELQLPMPVVYYIYEDVYHEYKISIPPKPLTEAEIEEGIQPPPPQFKFEWRKTETHLVYKAYDFNHDGYVDMITTKHSIPLALDVDFDGVVDVIKEQQS